MKIQVVDPLVQLLTPYKDVDRQLMLCGVAAGLSRGRVERCAGSVSHPCSPDSGGSWGIPPVLATSEISYGEASMLVKKLLSYEPNPHESILEHSTISFLVRCSRICTHELVRHRHTAYTQQSTRYCEEGDLITIIRPPYMPKSDLGDYQVGWYQVDCEVSKGVVHLVTDDVPAWVYSAAHAFASYKAARAEGVKRESARYLLPHCLSAWIMFSASFRQIRNMIRLRTAPQAAPEIRVIFTQIRTMLNLIDPVLLTGLEVP